MLHLYANKPDIFEQFFDEPFLRRARWWRVMEKIKRWFSIAIVEAPQATTDGTVNNSAIHVISVTLVCLLLSCRLVQRPDPLNSRIVDAFNGNCGLTRCRDRKIGLFMKLTIWRGSRDIQSDPRQRAIIRKNCYDNVIVRDANGGVRAQWII